MSKFLIIGLDNFGKSVACTLAEAGHFVMGVDHNPVVDPTLVDRLDSIITTDVISEENLNRIGVRLFDLVILASPHVIEANSSSIISSLKKLGATYVVANALKDKQGQNMVLLVADLLSIMTKEI
jgi:Trk K+ transport system NAD-binding subunit